MGVEKGQKHEEDRVDHGKARNAADPKPGRARQALADRRQDDEGVQQLHDGSVDQPFDEGASRQYRLEDIGVEQHHQQADEDVEPGLEGGA